VTAPADSELADALARLRNAEAGLREATLAGAAEATALARIARLERDVRDRARRASAAAPGAVSGATVPPAPAPAAFDGAALAAALCDRALVEFVNIEGVLHVVAVMGGQARLHAVTAVAEVEDELRFLTFALRRILAPARPRPASRAAFDDVLAAAKRVDDLLLAPLGLEPGRPVVVVPTRPLHQLPWGVLPSLAGRPVTVAPSAALWLRPRADWAVAASGPTVVVAGPDLPGADEEAADVAAAYRHARLLRGPEASVEGVLAALAGARLAHVAAHGRLRSDSPLFSSLVLADGALTLYDLERLAAPPDTFVLPACNAALPQVARGDEVLGMATALVGLGVRSVIAPVLPVPDAATRPFVLAVHAALRAGRAPGEALAATAAAAGGDDDDPAMRALAAAFVCIGADERGGAVSG
jgi:hypothetical protein